MEPKKKDVPEKAGCKLGITLPSAEDRDRFNEICQKEKKNQPETLIFLMDLYNKQPPSSNYAEKITLYMYIYSGHKKTPRRAISFQGRAEYLSSWSTLSQLQQTTAAKLWNDFGCPVGDGVPFLYSHQMNLFYDVSKRSYLIEEGIWVQAKDEEALNVVEGEILERPLEVFRCKYVNTFEEAYSCFSRYATPSELDGISRYLLDDIGEDYSLLDDYFGNIKFID